MTLPDPNADFYATPQRLAPAPGAPVRFPAPASAATPPPWPVAPTPRMPTWAKVLIALGAALTALVLLAIVASVALPVFLAQRAKAADAQVRTDLVTVARAQETFWSTTGSYTEDPTALGVAEPVSQVAILWADTQGYCLGGRDERGRGHIWYYSTSTGLSLTPCA